MVKVRGNTRIMHPWALQLFKMGFKVIKDDNPPHPWDINWVLQYGTEEDIKAEMNAIRNTNGGKDR